MRLSRSCACDRAPAPGTGESRGSRSTGQFLRSRLGLLLGLRTSASSSSGWMCLRAWREEWWNTGAKRRCWVRMPFVTRGCPKSWPAVSTSFRATGAILSPRLSLPAFCLTEVKRNHWEDRAFRVVYQRAVRSSRKVSRGLALEVEERSSLLTSQHYTAITFKPFAWSKAQPRAPKLP